MIEPLKFDGFGNLQPVREKSPLEIEHDLACAAEQELVRRHYEARAAALPKLEFKPFPPSAPGDTRAPLLIALEHASRAETVLREANAEPARARSIKAGASAPAQPSWWRQLWQRLRQLWSRS